MASDQSTNIPKLTESGLARKLGVSRQAVHQLVTRGILTKDAGGKIDVQEAEKALINSVHPSAKTAANLVAPSAPPPETASAPAESVEITSYHVAKTLREAAEAQIARLELSEMQGEVIRVDAVKSALSVAMATAREALLQIPSRLAPLLAADTDPASVQNLLHAEIHQALEHLSGAGSRLGQPVADLE